WVIGRGLKPCTTKAEWLKGMAGIMRPPAAAPFIREAATHEPSWRSDHKHKPTVSPPGVTRKRPGPTGPRAPSCAESFRGEPELRTRMEDTMKLYEFAPTRSIRVRWTLQELGAEFESVTVNMIAGEHRRPEFLKINPAGKLPVLVDGDLVLTESVAIVLYLADKYPEKGLSPVALE